MASLDSDLPSTIYIPQSSDPASDDTSHPPTDADCLYSQTDAEAALGHVDGLQEIPPRPQLANPPSAANTYCHPAQAEMLAAFRVGGRKALMEKILEKDIEFGPSLADSRLQGNPNSLRDGIYILCCLSDEFIESILQNTLAYDGLYKGVATREHAYKWNAPFQPAVYVNILAPANGVPLSRDQMLELLDAMEHFVDLDEIGPDEAIGTDDLRFERDGRYLHKGVYHRCETFKSGFGENYFSDTRDRVRENAHKFIAKQRELIANAPASVLYFPFGNECGWTKVLLKRLLEHWKMASTPQLFALARCLALHLFSDADFRLHAYSIPIFDPVDAELAEPILTNMVASYVGYGGFNVETAGLSVDGAVKINLRQWQLWRKQAVDSGMLAECDARHQAEVNSVDAAIAILQQKQADAELYQQILQTEHEAEAASKRYVEEVEAENKLHEQLAAGLDEAKKRRAARERDRQMAKRMAERVEGLLEDVASNSD